MDAQHKAAKVISGLVLLASILLLIDYYIAPKYAFGVVGDTEAHTERVTNRYGGSRLNQYGYWYASGIKISSNNFKCVHLLPGDSIILARSAIYKLQTELTPLSGYYKGVSCRAEYNPFGARGLFILLPILFCIGGIRSKEKGGSIIGAAVALAIYFADICSLFIL